MMMNILFIFNDVDTKMATFMKITSHYTLLNELQCTYRRRFVKTCGKLKTGR